MGKELGFVVLVVATTASGMSIKENSTSLGKSADGKSELFEDVSRGPEGGGAVTFRVTGGDEHKFLISSDFSPGDGSTPQTVAEKVCRERLGPLAALLKTRGFQGVALHPEVCGKKARSGAVTRRQSQK